MPKIIIKTFLFLSLFAAAGSTRAQFYEIPEIPLPENFKETVVDSVLSRYNNWGKVSISGKLSSPLLPVSASVKVFMVKDRLTIISVSAIMMGEVVRIEMDTEKMIMVNKINRTYTEIEVSDIEKIYPGGLRDFQSLLLGRVTVMGKGSLRKIHENDIEIYDTPSGNFAIVPNTDCQPSGYTYLYTINPENFMLSEFILVADNGSGEAKFRYSWQKNGAYSIDFHASDSRYAMDGDLRFNSPVWGAEPIDRFEITSKYRKVTLKEIMKMF